MFIPRNDWLIYLTYELSEKHPLHSSLINELFSVQMTSEGIQTRNIKINELGNWMKQYCINNNWIS